MNVQHKVNNLSDTKGFLNTKINLQPHTNENQLRLLDKKTLKIFI